VLSGRGYLQKKKVPRTLPTLIIRRIYLGNLWIAGNADSYHYGKQCRLLGKTIKRGVGVPRGTF